MGSSELNKSRMVISLTPYTFSYGFYFIVTVICLILYIISHYIGSVALYDSLLTGVISSVFTAGLIDYREVRAKNNKVEYLYRNAYSELWMRIWEYTNVWVRISRVLNKEDSDKQETALIWTEWFDVVKGIYESTDNELKKDRLRFIEKQLLDKVENLHKQVEFLLGQENLLRAEYLMNDEIKRTLVDIKIDFEYRTWFEKDEDIEFFWEMAEAANKDMYNYINRLGLDWMNKELIDC